MESPFGDFEERKVHHISAPQYRLDLMPRLRKHDALGPTVHPNPGFQDFLSRLV